MEKLAEKNILSASLKRYTDPALRHHFLRTRVTPLKKYLRKGMRILDCGCGVGVFVKTLTDLGYACDGIDLSKRSIEYGKKILHLRTLELGTVADLAQKEKRIVYNAVLATTLIEHLPDPAEFLHSVKRVLIKGGILVLEFPTPDSLSFRTMGSFWQWVMSPYHLFYFSRISMIKLLRRHGYRILEIGHFPTSGGWMESLTNRAGLSSQYRSLQRKKDATLIFSAVDAMLDKIAMDELDHEQKRGPSVLQFYCQLK
jgi:ubiquinone/menaquinone biosynthesis C-methylase UbiE